MSLYNFLFYILYKFVKLTTKVELQDQVPSSAHAGLFVCLTNNYATFLIFTGLIQYFPKNIYLSIIIFSIVPIFVHFFNKKLFIANENYKKIEEYYDKNNKLKKVHFILIAVLYIILSIGTMILAGINYANNS